MRKSYAKQDVRIETNFDLSPLECDRKKKGIYFLVSTTTTQVNTVFRNPNFPLNPLAYCFL